MKRSKHGKRKYDKQLQETICNGSSGYSYGRFKDGFLYTITPMRIRFNHYQENYEH
jgi:hypothetical protein